MDRFFPKHSTCRAPTSPQTIVGKKAQDEQARKEQGTRPVVYHRHHRPPTDTEAAKLFPAPDAALFSVQTRPTSYFPCGNFAITFAS